MLSTLVSGLIHIIIFSGLSLFTQVKSENRTYTRCYKATDEMYCFTTTFEELANFTEAQKHCAQINATLLVIKNEEVEKLVESFINDSNPNSGLTSVWTSAFMNESKTWHWLNSTVPLPSGFNLSSEKDVACLEFQRTNGTNYDFIPIESITTLSYICECSDFCFQFETANVLHHAGAYYVAFEANVTWYEARNRCFKVSCDLASFRDPDSINFTNWIDTTSGRRYWIGLQRMEWNWNNSGRSSQVIFTNWWQNYPNGPTVQCVGVRILNGAFKWNPIDCFSRIRTFAVCQTVTPLKQETNAAICKRSSSTISTTASINTAQMMGPEDDVGVRVGVGVGIGVGVPLLIGLVVIIIVVAVKRRRKYRANGKTLTSGSDERELENLPRDSLAIEKEDKTKKDGVYWEVKTDENASATTNNEDNTNISSATNVNNDSNIVYSDIEIGQGIDRNDYT